MCIVAIARDECGQLYRNIESSLSIGVGLQVTRMRAHLHRCVVAYLVKIYRFGFIQRMLHRNIHTN